MCLGFHVSANLIDTLIRIPISANGKTTPARFLRSIHFIHLWIGSNTFNHKAKKKQKKENKSSGDPGYPSPPRAPCQTQHMAKPILAPTGITLMTGTQHQLPRLHIRSSETCCHSNEGSNLKTAAKGSTRFLTNKDALERCMQEVSALTT